VEVVAITPANVNDGMAGPNALPEEPGEVFADSATGASTLPIAARNVSGHGSRKST